VYWLRSRLHLAQHSLGHKSSLAWKTKIQEQCRRLLTKITAFNKKADQFLGDIDSDTLLPVDHGDLDDDSEAELCDLGNEGSLSADDEHKPSDDEEDDDDEAEWAKNLFLAIPSSLGAEQCHEVGLDDLMAQEIQLRQGQANDALEDLQTEVAQKSLLFQTRVHDWPSQKLSTRSWSAIKRANGKIQNYVKKYNLALPMFPNSRLL
jgi:hypothetical protein